MEQGFNFDCRANKFAIRPVNVRVKGAEPQVSKNHLISSQVSDVEVFSILFSSMGYKKIKVVHDLSGFIKAAIDVL